MFASDDFYLECAQQHNHQEMTNVYSNPVFLTIHIGRSRVKPSRFIVNSDGYAEIYDPAV